MRPDFTSSHSERELMRIGQRSALLPMFLGALLAGVTTRGSSQQPFQKAWEENFEQGSLPSDFQWLHNAGPNNVQISNLDSPDAPADLRGRDPFGHCGRRALRFDTQPGSSRLTAAMARPFRRHLQREQDRVVFQADVFLPERMPGSVSLIGIAPPDSTGKHPWKLFRFGWMEGKVFFSFANGDPSPFIYVEDTVMFESLERGAWHRLQMEFTGTDTIRLSVDGVFPAFSPIHQPLLNELEPGLLVVSDPHQAGTVYADNLGVIWKQGGTEIPPSPWQPDLARRVAARPQPGAAIDWAATPDEARRRSMADDRPLVLMFYRTNAGALDTLEKIIRFDPSCKNVLTGFVPCRIDLASEPGKSLGQHLNIFRVPCIVMFTPQGRELDRIIYERETSWPEVVKRMLAIR